MFSCQIIGKPSGPNQRHHWAAKRRINQACADQVIWAIKGWRDRPSVPYQRVRITITWLRDRGPEMDYDNSVALGKCLVDAVVRGGLVVDDRLRNVDLVIRQETKHGRSHDAELMVEALP